MGFKYFFLKKSWTVLFFSLDFAGALGTKPILKVAGKEESLRGQLQEQYRVYPVVRLQRRVGPIKTIITARSKRAFL